MKTRHVGALAMIGAVTTFVGGVAFVGHLTMESDTPVRGVTALGLAEDGTLLARVWTCDGSPVRGEVTISRGTPDQPGTAVIATVPASPTVRVDPDFFDDPTSTTVLLVGAEGTEPARATVGEWQAVNPGRWLVTEPGADGTDNLALGPEDVRDRMC